jgi:hypothetical protein
VDPLAIPDLKAQYLDLQVQLELQEQLVLVDPLDMMACVALLGIKVKKDLEDLLAILDPQDI